MIKNVKDIQNQINMFPLADFVMPCIHFNSNSQAVIDGCKGVLEYQDGIVRINCGSLLLKFSGTNLSIKTLTSEQYIVTGKILSLEFFAC